MAHQTELGQEVADLQRRLRIAGPFALDQALRFLNDFAPTGARDQGYAYVGAHVLSERTLLVQLAAREDGQLSLGITGPSAAPDDLDAAEALVRRVFSLDWDGAEFYQRVGQADPVLSQLQARFPGLRPVLFGSPFEALCWAVIGQRITIAQAAQAKARLTEAFGPTMRVEGRLHRAFPAPEHLLELHPEHDGGTLGLPGIKIERLRGLAERGVRGDFDAHRLLEMTPEAARAWLEQSAGIGPWASEFTLIRGAGHPDLLPRGERRLLVAVRRYYGLDHEPSPTELERLGERWAGYRSWAAFLLLVAIQEDTHEIAAPLAGAMEAPYAAG